MKELSIEEKVRAYDEALEKAKNYHSPETECNVRIAMENLFPELKESEDWIPKEIAKYLKEKGDFRSCWIVWIEKQGEQNPVDDVKVLNQEFWRGYKYGEQQRFGKYADCNIEENSVELSEEDKDLIYNIEQDYKDKLNNNPPESLRPYYNKVISLLKSIKDRVIPQPQKEWSEEDEEIIRSLLDIIYECHSYGKCALKLNEYSKLCDWLKSLKDRHTWKPSDEQMEALLYEVNAWDEDSINGQNLKSLYQNLKKLMEE